MARFTKKINNDYMTGKDENIRTVIMIIIIIIVIIVIILSRE